MANVVIINKRRSKITVGVLNAAGKLTALHLGPLARSGPIAASKIPAYTKQLAATKHLELINVP
jgi:hypothetical protein